MSPNSATGASLGPRHLDLPRRPDIDRVAAGVAFVRKTLADWHVGSTEEPSVDVVLVAAELLSNAERHGGGTRWLEIERVDSRLRLTVHDDSPRHPRPVLPHRPERTGGHGLYIVDRLSTAWGWRPLSQGKAVWAELTLVPPPGK